jgi:hypothetical protein
MLCSFRSLFYDVGSVTYYIGSKLGMADEKLERVWRKWSCPKWSIIQPERSKNTRCAGQDWNPAPTNHNSETSRLRPSVSPSLSLTSLDDTGDNNNAEAPYRHWHEVVRQNCYVQVLRNRFYVYFALHVLCNDVHIHRVIVICRGTVMREQYLDNLISWV